MSRLPVGPIQPPKRYRGKSCWSMKLTTHLHVVVWLRMSGAIHGMNRDKFTYILPNQYLLDEDVQWVEI
jgi:hypothetical protein